MPIHINSTQLLVVICRGATCRFSMMILGNKLLCDVPTNALTKNHNLY